jgi:hypothetical protein
VFHFWPWGQLSYNFSSFLQSFIVRAPGSSLRRPRHYVQRLPTSLKFYLITENLWFTYTNVIWTCSSYWPAATFRDHHRLTQQYIRAWELWTFFAAVCSRTCSSDFAQFIPRSQIIHLTCYFRLFLGQRWSNFATETSPTVQQKQNTRMSPPQKKKFRTFYTFCCYEVAWCLEGRPWDIILLKRQHPKPQ